MADEHIRLQLNTLQRAQGEQVAWKIDESLWCFPDRQDSVSGSMLSSAQLKQVIDVGPFRNRNGPKLDARYAMSGNNPYCVICML